MSNAAPADGCRMAETACGLGSEGPTSAVARDSAAGAQPIDLQQPSQPNNCSDCGKGLYKRNATGRCQPCHRIHVSRASRYCSSCRTHLSKGSRSGLCFTCYHQLGSANLGAEEGSRRLRDAIRSYLRKYQPEAMRFGR